MQVSDFPWKLQCPNGHRQSARALRQLLPQLGRLSLCWSRLPPGPLPSLHDLPRSASELSIPDTIWTFTFLPGHQGASLPVPPYLVKLFSWSLENLPTSRPQLGAIPLLRMPSRLSSLLNPIKNVSSAKILHDCPSHKWALLSPNPWANSFLTNDHTLSSSCVSCFPSSNVNFLGFTRCLPLFAYPRGQPQALHRGGSEQRWIVWSSVIIHTVAQLKASLSLLSSHVCTLFTPLPFYERHRKPHSPENTLRRLGMSVPTSSTPYKHPRVKRRTWHMTETQQIHIK